MGAPATIPDSSPDLRAQKDALDRILHSGVLDRAPNLGLMLRYLCEQHFSGRLADLKEYNIAVDALGRPSDFDQKKDSIVRVEAHRLRKRLADYYRAAGVNDPVILTLPAGTYAPRFEVRRIEEPPGGDAPAATARRAWRLETWWIAAAAVLVAVAVFVVLARRSIAPAAQFSAPPRQDAAALPGVLSEVRVLPGLEGDRFVDSEGNLWSGDRFFEGGTVFKSPPRPILRTPDPAIYLKHREGDFWYHIPVKPGVYELRLHFAETVFGEGNIAGGGESSRVFAVEANGERLPITDIVTEAGGPNTALIHVFKNISPTQDGRVHLHFIRVKEMAIVNAIELLPGVQEQMLPVRIVAKGTAAKDGTGQDWRSDRYFNGGQMVSRHENIEGAPSQELFRGERYGNFSYDVPVAPDGRYSLNLHFAENWFGPGRPGGGGQGSRLFDIYCNGRTLLRNFDVFREAGGSMRALTKTFRGLEPNAQGKLLLTFVPVRNYAMVNAIEVVDESR